ncbi:MAG: hypothetical protein U9O89_05335 [Thermoproteota archaeon]|nr:hypothetical protein [Thermoproteota archaeon]
MSIVAFDAGDFSRWKKVNGQKKTIFFTPLGVGIVVKQGKEEQFKSIYHSSRKKLIEDFQVPTKRLVYSHSNLWKEVDHAKAIPICDRIVTDLQKTIEYIFCSFVILPPKEIKKVSVGGYGCPLEEIHTMKSLRALTPMFSYITAWAYSGRHRFERKTEYLIDNFSSKHTTAWRDLTSHVVPKIFPKGDECNEFISVADMVCYLTEKKLWDQKLWLEPNNVEKVWDNYDFCVETRFLDKRVQSKIRWYSKQEISTENYLTRPMVFIDIEGISISELGRGPITSAATYACSKGGAFQGFDQHIDSKKIRDGDIYVYAGREAKKRATAFKDMFDIEVYSVKELRAKTEHLLN